MKLFIAVSKEVYKIAHNNEIINYRCTSTAQESDVILKRNYPSNEYFHTEIEVE